MRYRKLIAGRPGRFVVPIAVALAAAALPAGAAVATAASGPGASTPTTTPPSTTPAPSSTSPAFAPAQVVASSGATGVSVAMNPQGTALVAWDDETGPGHTYVQTDGARGVLGPVQSLWTGPGYRVNAALASDSTSAVTWMYGQSLLGAVARPSHNFATPQTLASSVSTQPGATKLVATPGRAVAVWLAPASQGSSVIDYAVAGSNGRFGASQALVGTAIAAPLLATSDSAGDVIIAYWTATSTAQQAATTGKGKSKPKNKPKPKPTSNGTLAYAILPSGATTFGAAQPITSLTGTAKPSANVSMTSGPGGVAVAYAGNQFSVATMGSSGVFGNPSKAGMLPAPSSGASFTGPAVAMPSLGGPMATWSEDSGHATNGPITRGHLVVAQQPNGPPFSAAPLTASTTLAQSPLAAATSDLSIVVFGQGPESAETLDYSVSSSGSTFTSPRTLSTTPLVPPVTRPSTTSVYLAPLPASIAGSNKHALVAWLIGTTLYSARLDES